MAKSRKRARAAQDTDAPDTDIHPRQLARAMGVSESSIKRWCDDGLLPCRKTAGGHRRLMLDGVVRFLRQQGFQLARPELLGLPARARDDAGAGVSARLLSLLEAGDEAAARDLVVGLVVGSSSVAQVFDEVVAPAFHQIGHAWERGDLEVYREHRAVEIAMRILRELRPMVSHAGADAPVAIGATLEGDPYTVAITMTELVLREAGWKAECLGPNHPVATLRAAIDDLAPALVWIGVSYAPDAGRLVEQYAEVHDAARARRSAIVVGGRALTAEVRARMRYTAYGERMGDLLGLSEALLPQRAPDRSRSLRAARSRP